MDDDDGRNGIRKTPLPFGLRSYESYWRISEIGPSPFKVDAYDYNGGQLGICKAMLPRNIAELKSRKNCFCLYLSRVYLWLPDGASQMTKTASLVEVTRKVDWARCSKFAIHYSDKIMNWSSQLPFIYVVHYPMLTTFDMGYWLVLCFILFRSIHLHRQRTNAFQL